MSEEAKLETIGFRLDKLSETVRTAFVKLAPLAERAVVALEVIAKSRNVVTAQCPYESEPMNFEGGQIKVFRCRLPMGHDGKCDPYTIEVRRR